MILQLIQWIRTNYRITCEAVLVLLVIFLLCKPSYREKTTLNQTATETTKSNSTATWESEEVTKTEKKKDGTEVTTKTKRSKGIKNTKENSKDVVKTQIVTIKNYYRYSLDVFQLVPLKDILVPYDTENTKVIVGYRILDLPVFVTAGTNLKLNEVGIGLRLEF